MADETPQQTTPPTPPVAPAQGEPVKPPTPLSTKDLEGKTPDEIVKIVSEKSEELGGVKKTVADLENYRNITQPFIETLVSDPELMKSLEEKHNRRLGINQPQPTQQTGQTPQPAKDDTRKALEFQIINQFETAKGIDKLDVEKKKEVSVKIGQELMEMLDPGGNKSYNELVTSISLEKLPKYLEKAYNLATMDENLKKAQESGAQQAQYGSTGQIGSMASSSSTPEGPILTPDERELAKKMGVTEENWLKRKKEIEEARKR